MISQDLRSKSRRGLVLGRGDFDLSFNLSIKQKQIYRMELCFAIAALLCLPGSLQAGKDQPRKAVRIALASIRRSTNVSAGVRRIKQVLRECQDKNVEIVCFPETYLPGLRGLDKNLPTVNQPAMEEAVHQIRASCREYGVVAIVGLEWKSELGLENRAVVISSDGEIVGYQTKNQITPGGESKNYVPDGKRRMFEVHGVKFGIVICHEGWRYPETVRWAAVRGAKIVFQPQVTGRDGTPRIASSKWGESFYEKAMQCRAEENSIYLASVNRAMTRQNSATSLIAPDGNLMDYVPRGEEELLVADIDLTRATGFYASRFHPEWLREGAGDEEKEIEKCLPSPRSLDSNRAE